MRLSSYLTCLLAASITTGVCPAASAQSTTRPDVVFSKVVTGMPTTAEQEIRVLKASFKPGDQTVFHTHRSPVTVYILEGAFTLELEGKDPVVINAGQSFVEPPNVRMTGYNRSATQPLHLIIFYVSEPGTPFLDPIGH